MILFVDLEHRSLGNLKPQYYAYVQEKRLRAQRDLESLSGQACSLVYFCDDRLADLAREADLIVMSGHNSDYEHYTAKELAVVRLILREPPCPVFTICGSFQLMVQVHGGRIGPIGERASSAEIEVDPILPASIIQENGFIDIQKLDTAISPFDGLPRMSKMQEHHYWEVKNLPSAFVSCARSEICREQAVVHRTLPLAGVQFHPEDFTEEHADGRELLLAVIEWAGKA